MKLKHDSTCEDSLNNHYMDSISCIIPCYNSELTVLRAVNSVLAQTSSVEEIILVDDCSTDKTWDLIQSIAAKEAIIKIVGLDRNGGPAIARNRGWALASSRWLAFLDADDAWHRQKIELTRKALRLYPHVNLWGHTVDIQSPDVKIPEAVYTEDMLRAAVRPISPLSVKLSNPFSTPTVVLRRDSPYRFNKEMRFVEDYHLWASLVLSGVRCARIDLPMGHLFKARYGSSGLSAQTQSMRSGEILALRCLKEEGLLGRLEHYFLQFFWYLKYLGRNWL